MMMIKSNGGTCLACLLITTYMLTVKTGSGSVSNVIFENFIGHGNAYSLDIDQYWSSETTVDGDGVQLDNITFSVSLRHSTR